MSKAGSATTPPARFRAYGWNVIGPVDGHDAAAVEAAIAAVQAGSGKPTLIVCRTQIGWGSPNKVGSHDVHGAPLGADETVATRVALGWPHAPVRGAGSDPRQAWDGRPAGAAAEDAWRAKFAAWQAQHPALAAEFERTQAGDLPADWTAARGELLAKAGERQGTVATRKSSQNCLDFLVDRIPELLGGSADLTGSNLTAGKGSVAWHDCGPDAAPNYISYGVREFGMTAIMNGVALHGGLIPYGGTFAVFSDYSRNAIRMSSLMKQRVVHVLTHDSIGLGEDGPTHQPVEHVSSLRIIPGLDVWRPCDELETAVAWSEALERRDGPSVLFLSRQNLAQYGNPEGRADGIRRGGYVLSEADGAPQAVIIATGSEVSLAMVAQATLKAAGDRGARGVDALHAALRPAVVQLAQAGVAARGLPDFGGSRADRLLAQVCRHRRRSSRHRRIRRIGAGAGIVRTFRPDRRASGADCIADDCQLRRQRR